MNVFVGFIAVFILVLAILLALSLGVGFTLSWMISDIPFGTAVLIGVVSVSFVLYFMATVMRKMDEVAEDTPSETQERTAETIPNWPRKRRKRPTPWTDRRNK